MTLSRDKYIVNNIENREKLINHIIENASMYDLHDLARKELENHYCNEDQHFIDDYYETFTDEDPELNGAQEEADTIIYYHGHHSNPCVVGEIHKSETIISHDGSSYRGIEAIMITHDIQCKDYDDNLSDITKVWDSQTQSEVCNSRYDTDPDTCIHIPLNIGEHTNLSNQVLKQILLNNNVEFVSFGSKDDLTSLSNFLENNLGV
jgi:hypothetical protein